MNNETLQSKFQPTGSIWKISGKFTFRVILLLAIFLAGYYFFFLAPKIALSNAYYKTEKITIEHRANLLQNRLAFTGLARLDADSANVNGEKIDLLAILQKTNEEGLRLLDKKNELPGVEGISSKLFTFQNNKLTDSYSLLLEEERAVLEAQKGFIMDIESFNEVTKSLLQYPAEQDLGKLDLALQKKEIISHADSAREGIGKISEKLGALNEKFSDAEVLQDNIKKTQIILDDLVMHLKNGNMRKAEISRAQAIKYFSEMRKNTIAAQSSFIRSESSVKLLTRETNLILNYDLWLKKIDNYQEKFAKKQ